MVDRSMKTSTSVVCGALTLALLGYAAWALTQPGQVLAGLYVGTLAIWAVWLLFRIWQTDRRR
jgi:hypothetical protein